MGTEREHSTPVSQTAGLGLLFIFQASGDWVELLHMGSEGHVSSGGCQEESFLVTLQEYELNSSQSIP